VQCGESTFPQNFLLNFPLFYFWRFVLPCALTAAEFLVEFFERILLADNTSRTFFALFPPTRGKIIIVIISTPAEEAMISVEKTEIGQTQLLSETKKNTAASQELFGWG